MFSQHEMFMIREYYNSLIKKWSDYLVVPNSLLLFNAPSLTILLNTSSYARDTARPTQTKGSTEFLLFCFFMPFCHLGKCEIRLNLFIKTIVNYEEKPS